jgi:uncharacterized Zn finger protein (UPF0148 family)
MAVPKKRTSKSKKNLRKTVWKQKALKQAVKAYSTIKMVEGIRSKTSEIREISEIKQISDQSTDSNPLNQ